MQDARAGGGRSPLRGSLRGQEMLSAQRLHILALFGQHHAAGDQRQSQQAHIQADVGVVAGQRSLGDGAAHETADAADQNTVLLDKAVVGLIGENIDIKDLI